MNSIRKKLFIYIGFLVLLLVGLTIFANTTLMEPYYMSRQKHDLLDTYEYIEGLDKNSYASNTKEYLFSNNNQRIGIVISDTDSNVIYTTSSFTDAYEIVNPDKPVPPPYNSKPNQEMPMKKYNVLKDEYINENIRLILYHDTAINVRNLKLRGTLSNGYLIEIKTPVAAFESSVEINNKFILMVGGITFIIAMILAYLISNIFTKPIIKMNNTTKELKNFNFNSKCEVKSRDEIGQLAQSINEMSNALSNNIDAINNKNDQLEVEIDEKNRLDERRKELLNNVSHELKSPLSLMQGYAEGLKLNVAKSKEQSDFYCEVIMDEANKMNQLVEKLLNINQVEFGDTTLQKSKFEINEFIESVFKKYRKVFDDKEIKSNLSKSNQAMVIADEIMIESVFTNFLNNAANYVDENKRIAININEINNKIRVSVFNTAKKLSDSDIKKLWNSFYKVDKSRTRDKGGHGLGLSIVKAIQEAHENEYGVENVDDGVRFWFELDKV